MGLFWVGGELVSDWVVSGYGVGGCQSVLSVHGGGWASAWSVCSWGDNVSLR